MGDKGNVEYAYEISSNYEANPQFEQLTYRTGVKKNRNKDYSNGTCEFVSPSGSGVKNKICNYETMSVSQNQTSYNGFSPRHHKNENQIVKARDDRGNAKKAFKDYKDFRLIQ